MKKRFLILVIMLLVLFQFAFSLRHAERKSRIIIDHLNSMIRTPDSKITERKLEGETFPFTIRENEEVSISVIPNPLLFNYKWKGETRTKTEDYKAALEFAKAIDTLISIMGVPDISGSSRLPASNFREGNAEDSKIGRIDAAFKSNSISPNILGGNVKDFLVVFRERIRELKTYLEQIDIFIQATDKPEKVSDIKKEVEKWNVKTLKKMIDDDFEKMNKALAEFTDKYVESETKSQRDIKLDSIGNFLVNLIQKGSKEKISTIQGAEEIKSEFSQNKLLENGDKKKSDQLRAVVYFLSHLTQKTSIEKMTDTLVTFEKEVNSIGQEIPLGTIVYSDFEDITANIEISSKQNIKSSTLKTGDFKFTFSPYKRVKIEFAAAFVYSFVRKIEYTTEETTEGFKIMKKDDGNEYHGQNVAAMLIITPKFLDSFKSYAEIGINPIKDKIALFAGIGVKYGKVFSFGGGITFQQIEKLDGLNVGDILKSADELKTVKKFKSGIYLHVTANIK